MLLVALHGDADARLQNENLRGIPQKEEYFFFQKNDFFYFWEIMTRCKHVVDLHFCFVIHSNHVFYFVVVVAFYTNVTATSRRPLQKTNLPIETVTFTQLTIYSNFGT